MLATVSMNIDCESNLEQREIGGHLNNLPTIAYLPHFTSPVAREPHYQDSLMDLMVAEGKTGEVLRNVLFRLSKEKRKEIERSLENQFNFKRERGEILDILFDAGQEAYITVNRLQPRPKRTERSRDRDLLLEGSGCLQWLSVLSYAYREETDVLLLDEPDAHMHGNLQVALFEELLKVCNKQNKQVIIATHSARMVEESKKYLEGVNVIGMDLRRKNLDERVQCLETEDAIDEFFLYEIDEKAKKPSKPSLFVEGKNDKMVYEKVVLDYFYSFKNKVEITLCDGWKGVRSKVKSTEKMGKCCGIVDSEASVQKEPNIIKLGSETELLPENLREVVERRKQEDKKLVVALGPPDIDLESFYSHQVRSKFCEPMMDGPAKKMDGPAKKMDGPAKKKAAEHVANGQDSESLNNFRPVIRKALANAFLRWRRRKSARA